MKQTILIAVGLLLFSCGNSDKVEYKTVENRLETAATENNSSETVKKESVQETRVRRGDRFVGNVRLLENSTCGKLIIEVKEENKITKKVIPLDLPAEYQKEGLFIRFTGVPAKKMAPKGCDAIYMSVSELTRLRSSN